MSVLWSGVLTAFGNLNMQWGDVATWLTAIGTLALAVAAVWIALWSERRTDERVAKERQLSEERLRKERALGAA